MRPLKLGPAGMRGAIGPGLTPERAIAFASAFGTLIDGGRVVVAVDTRFSSDMLRHAVIAALQGCGCQVIDAGITPAPLVHFMVPELAADGALLIGGGHQAAGWNAIIAIGSDGAALNSIRLRELFDIYHSRRYRSCRWDAVNKPRAVPAGIDDRYIERLGERLNIDLIAAAEFTVIADFCNGSGSILSDKFAERLGIRLVPINNVLSGVLPHDPEPRPRSGFQIQAIIGPLHADAGFVFNSDMSRAAVVTDRGETLSEEYTLPLAAGYLLEKADPATRRVVTNVCSTRTLDDIVAAHGGVLEKTHVSQANVIDRMKEVGALFGGEGCGGFAVGGWVKGFDAFMMAGIILEAMAVSKVSAGELAESLPRYHIVKKTVHCPSAHAYTLIHGLKEHFTDARITELDGLRFDWKDGWISVRAAATEPVIRMICEWKNEEVAIDRALQARGLLERLVAS